MECSVEGCSRARRYKATGWCQTHYHRNWRTGSVSDPQPVNEMSGGTGYRVRHSRNVKKWGPASDHECVECGSQAKEYAYDGQDADELTGLTRVNGVEYPVTWSRWPEFYMPLCFPCHRLKDRSEWASKRTHCTHGHEMTLENTYTRPSRPGSRECRQCKDDDYRRRRARRSK